MSLIINSLMGGHMDFTNKTIIRNQACSVPGLKSGLIHETSSYIALLFVYCSSSVPWP